MNKVKVFHHQRNPFLLLGQLIIITCLTETTFFIGHYWLRADEPKLQSPSVCCLDYSVAKGGQLVAYRWNRGEVTDANLLVCKVMGLKAN